MNRMRRAQRSGPVPHSVVGPSPWGKASRRLAATALATITLAVPRQAEARSTQSSQLADPAQVKELNSQAQQSYDDRNYRSAVESWGQILKLLPENRTNREERETTLLVALDAYVREFEEQDATSLTEAVATLKAGVAMYDDYVKKFHREYGSDANVGPEAYRIGTDIRRLYDEARSRLPPPPTEDTEDTEDTTVITDPKFDRPSGLRLIVGGAVTIAGGLAATSLIIVGSSMSKRASRESSDAETEDEMDDVDRRGKTGDSLVITGAVLGGLMLAGGSTMLVFGVRQRIRYLAVAPNIGRGYVGVSLGGRF